MLLLQRAACHPQQRSTTTHNSTVDTLEELKSQASRVDEEKHPLHRISPTKAYAPIRLFIYKLGIRLLKISFQLACLNSPLRRTRAVENMQTNAGRPWNAGTENIVPWDVKRTLMMRCDPLCQPTSHSGTRYLRLNPMTGKFIKMHCESEAALPLLELTPPHLSLGVDYIHPDRIGPVSTGSPLVSSDSASFPGPEEELYAGRKLVSFTNRSWSNKRYYLTRLVSRICIR
ncbi:hypothetical protein UY3_18301 [Chelonia mydas]|uniref:Uncharacterized protein n=1 Tax=Chelonia mydas TaxID=8469 RepID=M7AHX4_CHEMY|nr:hypothetical protein UY3_18301 [Chelonia mydas]